MASNPNTITRRVIGLLVGVFGLATVFSGGSVALRLGMAPELAGDVIPFVVWFNFAAGFAYLAAAWGIWTERNWARWIAVTIAVATFLVAVGFGIVVTSGQEFEMRTIGALGFRFLVWAGIAVWLIRSTRRTA